MKNSLSSYGILRTNSLQQNGVPVIVQKFLLAAGKPSDINDPYNVDAHSLERGSMSHWRDYETSIVLESDETAIEQMINARGQE